MKSLAIRLIAPEYTGVAAQLLAPGLTQFRALEGTRLELEGLANKPLAHAELRRGDQSGRDVPGSRSERHPIQDDAGCQR